MVELVDTPDLGSGAERCEGSSPSWRTITKKGRNSLLLRPFALWGIGGRLVIYDFFVPTGFEPLSDKRSVLALCLSGWMGTTIGDPDGGMMHDSRDEKLNHNSHGDESDSPKPRVLEKEKVLLLALALLVSGALILGVFAHSEGIEARTALKDIRSTLTDAANSL
uniref:Uncharacterized protein n=3 Tax=Alcanivoracaceae TaxID=224372 RepID=Q0VRU9_ALCBS|nr:hypothetical protein ABO_0651 [Alcanivorax borkumensis SK2]